MAAFDSTLLGDYLLGVLLLAAIAFALAVGMGARVVTSNRRLRLARHQSMRTYYGRTALHS
jgi:hypothetical protein